MCGIWALIDQGKYTLEELYKSFLELQHRGPNFSSFQTYNAENTTAVVGFSRLSIINSSAYGNQPFVLEDEERTIVCVCNGEIYNWKELRDRYGLQCENDCLVIPQMYMQCYHNQTSFEQFVSELDGEFAFTLLEFRQNVLERVCAARDQIGIRPLYTSANTSPNVDLFFTSEVKGAPKDMPVKEFPPGKLIMYYMNDGTEDSYDFSTVYNVRPSPQKEETHLRLIENAVTNAVHKRLNGSKPFAYLLSGGVDSSLVAALGAKQSKAKIKTFCCSIKPGTYQIGSDTFTTGFGTDLLYAREVAEHIGSDHTEVFFTPQEGFDAIGDVIKTIESWDTTTVRASVGQYMVCKWIREHTDCKVVMVGEGPDEVCSSYLFNWYAPNGEALDESAREYVKNIHYYDVKRADRCISRWGLEGRVPLLDPEFIRTYWEIPGGMRLPRTKGIEKWWLRKAFEEGGTSSPLDPLDHNGSKSLLPERVLWRKKEAFSDGVSDTKSWYEMLQDFFEDKISDDAVKRAATDFPYCTPTTKEAYAYRCMYESHFPGREIIPGFWQPKWDAKGEVRGYVDPSARTLGLGTC
jgi:asparagine synthase (glutamine-hydrolysing)